MADVGLTITEAAKRTGMSLHALRYYERSGVMLEVGRAGSGHRRYSEADLEWLQLIANLRATGMPIRDVRRYAELVRAGGGNEPDRLALLRAHRDRVQQQLDQVTVHLRAIDAKIGFYAGDGPGMTCEVSPDL